MKASLLLFLALSCASCFAATTECQSNFQVGQLHFCVTQNGNIASFYDGNLSTGAEGYGICAPSGPYYDLGLYGDSGNWAPATITQPKGPNTFPITITRYTADGEFRVIQTFSFAGAGSSVQVKLDIWTLTVRPQPITFFRYADPAGSQQYGDQVARTAFVWNRTATGFMATSPNGQKASLILGGVPNVCNWEAPGALPYSGDSATLLKWEWTGGRLKALFNYAPIR